MRWEEFVISSVSMKRYYELHRAQPYRKYGYFHTSRETLKLRGKGRGYGDPDDN